MFHETLRNWVVVTKSESGCVCVSVSVCLCVCVGKCHTHTYFSVCAREKHIRGFGRSIILPEFFSDYKAV